MTDTLPLFDVPGASVPDETAALLDLIAGDLLHAGDRALIVRAIVAEAHACGGKVDLNRVRARLTNADGHLTVTPQVVGPVVHALCRKGVLVTNGWGVNEDKASGNAGKPLRRYRMVAKPEVAA